MRKLLFFCYFFIFSFSVLAVQKAVTEQGDIVLLNTNGTWQYEDEKTVITSELTLNPETFVKDKDSNFTLKSLKTSSTFSINAKQWDFGKNNGDDHAVAEYTFQLKNSDLYGMAISEQIEIDVNELTNIAFENAKVAAPNAEIVKKEYRVVNGHKVIYMEIIGTIQSIQFKYFGYYYSDATGSTQYLAYTGANLEKKYKKEINNFLNGFSSNYDVE